MHHRAALDHTGMERRDRCSRLEGVPGELEEGDCTAALAASEELLCSSLPMRGGDRRRRMAMCCRRSIRAWRGGTDAVDWRASPASSSKGIEWLRWRPHERGWRGHSQRSSSAPASSCEAEIDNGAWKWAAGGRPSYVDQRLSADMSISKRQTPVGRDGRVHGS